MNSVPDLHSDQNLQPPKAVERSMRVLTSTSSSLSISSCPRPNTFHRSVGGVLILVVRSSLSLIFELEGGGPEPGGSLDWLAGDVVTSLIGSDGSNLEVEGLSVTVDWGGAERLCRGESGC